MTLSTGFFDKDGIWRATQQEILELPFAGLIIAAGTPLAAFANGVSTTPGLALDNAKAACVRWNNDAAPAAFLLEAQLPRHRQPQTDLILHIIASKSGATVGDATTFAVSAWAQTIAALSDAATDAGGTTNAMVGNAAAKTEQHLTLKLIRANIPDTAAGGLPSALTLAIKPTAGTLGTDDVSINSMWLEYTKISNAA